MRVDGSIARAYEVAIDEANDGTVSAILPAEDGGLYIAGHELIQPDLTDRTLFIARVNATHDGVIWARSMPLAFSDIAAGLTRAANGDLIVTTGGFGATMRNGMVLRMRSDGTVPGCSMLAPAALTIKPLTTGTTLVSVTGFDPPSPGLVAVTPLSDVLGATTSSCSR